MLRRRKESDFFCPNVGRISFCVHYTMLISMISMQQSYQNIRTYPINGDPISNVQLAFTCPVAPVTPSHAQSRPVTTSRAQSCPVMPSHAWWQCDRISVCA